MNFTANKRLVTAGNECHVEFVPSSRHEEIQKEGGEKSTKAKKLKILMIKSQGLSRYLSEVSECVSNLTGFLIRLWPNLHIRRLSALH